MPDGELHQEDKADAVMVIISETSFILIVFYLSVNIALYNK